MKIKIYLEKGATLPSTAHCNDYGYDVKATSLKISGQIFTFGTGIHVAVPPKDENGKKLCLHFFARSSIFKTGLILSNGVGVIDPDYRGEIKAHFYKIVDNFVPTYDVSNRIGQLALSNGEEIEWVEVSSLDELGQTERGCGGFGSTGK